MRDVKKEILDKLTEIEKKEAVKVLYAVESGSRAWGVESPDSDYDVRFVYVRSKEDYLKIQEKRDVIEWANSPIVYKTTAEWEEIEKMLGRKAKSDEKAMNPKIPAIQKYIEDEIARYRQISKDMEDDRIGDWDGLDEAFLKVLEMDETN
ncbi:MAG: hypothetical protein HDR01_14195 [Lachnospiraceae bacterium]|nr:hypothetical protein [Lachnospiraceae bacterium]